MLILTLALMFWKAEAQMDTGGANDQQSRLTCVQSNDAPSPVPYALSMVIYWDTPTADTPAIAGHGRFYLLKPNLSVRSWSDPWDADHSGWMLAEPQWDMDVTNGTDRIDETIRSSTPCAASSSNCTELHIVWRTKAPAGVPVNSYLIHNGKTYDFKECRSLPGGDR